MENILFRILVLPFVPIIFAYFELGGNWFALRLFQGGTNLWSVGGTLLFSVVYSMISAFVAMKLKMDMGLLMVAYGFGFSIVAIFLKLEWGRIPEFSSELIKEHSALYLVGLIALVGFLVSSYLVVTTEVK